MSRFSGNSIRSIRVMGTTATALQMETLGRFTERYLLRAHPPARLKASEAAELLGFHEDDMALLVRENLIEPLGEPTHNAVKYFALNDVEAMGRDGAALAAATKAIYARNKGKSADSCSQVAADDFLICECVVGGN
jgi:hypothetical protein